MWLRLQARTFHVPPSASALRPNGDSEFSAAAAAATPNLLLTSRSPTGCLPPAQSEKSVVNPDWELRRGHAPRSGRPGRPTLPRGYRWRCVNPPRRRPQPHRTLGTSPATMDSVERLLVPTRHSCGCACRRGQFTSPFRLRPSCERRFRILRGNCRGHIGPNYKPIAD
jgi:hypothetical protein